VKGYKNLEVGDMRVCQWEGGGGVEVPWVSSCRGLITGMFFVFFEQLHKIGRLQSPSANGLFLFIYLLVLAKVRGILGSP